LLCKGEYNNAFKVLKIVFEMGQEYYLAYHAVKEFLPRFRGILEEAVESGGISDRVELDSQENIFVDHGQNPLADCDLRPYIIVSRGGERVFPEPDDFQIKLVPCNMDAPRYVDQVVRVIQADIEKNEGVGV
jgi:hypothetical protein